MTREDVIQKVNKFLVEEFELEEDAVIPEANLRDDLDIESLDFVDIAVEIEKEFNFKLNGEEMVGVATLGDLYEYILTKVK